VALLTVDGPLDLAATLESGQAFRWRRVEPSPDGSPWFEGVAFGNLIHARQTRDGVEFTTSPDPESDVAPLLRDYLRLDEDLTAIYQALEFDEHVRQGIALYPGLRILRQDPWECLASFICSANNNVRRIARNVDDMSAAFGSPVTGGADERRSFPTPTQLADAGEASLRALGLGFRAKYIAATAERIAGANTDLFALRLAPYQEALDALTELPGVGDKIANCAMLFSLDKPEAFPVDVWIDRALRDWHFTEQQKPIQRNRMRPWAQARFGRYAGYANQYLFHSRRLGRR
jgi:N-glycosylase/DNA lyase|tara:strand:- start:1833 stop:2702 length:870 start_codon:yes stop_codon:yes gene_type:complete